MTKTSRRNVLVGGSVLIMGSIEENINNDIDTVNNEEWPSFQFDSRNSGGSTTLTAPTEFVEKQWQIRHDSSGVRPSMDNTSPVVVDEKVYAEGSLFDIRNGQGLWSQGGWGGWAATHESMIIESRGGGSMYGLDIESETKKWEIYNGFDDFTPPTVNGGSVYVGDDDGELYKIDAESGETDWTRNYSSISRFHGAPAVDNNHIYIIASRYASYSSSGDVLYKWSTEDSSSSEIFSEGSPNRYSPTVDNTTVYISDRNTAKAIDKNTLSVRWEQQLDGSIIGSAALSDDLLFCPAADSNEDRGWVYALDKNTGEVIWQRDVELVSSSPVAVEEVIFIGTTTGEIYALDSATGSEKWTYKLDSGITGSPAVANGNLYFMTDNRELIALTENPNDPPEANFTYEATPPTVDEEITFNGIDSEDDNGIESYLWEFGDNETVTGIQANHTFFQPGTHEVKLTVTDVAGLTDTQTESIEVRRASQIPEPEFTYTPVEPLVSETITFDASPSFVSDGEITHYEWEFDTESTYEGEIIEYTFSEPGQHLVTLRVRDNEGLKATQQQVVEVQRERLNITVTSSAISTETGSVETTTLSVTNFLNSEELTIQLLLETPSGVEIRGVSGASEGSNQYTAVTTLEPTKHESLQIDMVANDPGEHEITAIADYYFEGDQQDSGRHTETIRLTADPTADRSDEDVTETNYEDVDDEAPGFTIPSSLAGVAGIGYLVRSRLKSEENNTDS